MKLVNVVVSGTFSNNINLPLLSNTVYQPKRFNGAVCKHEKCTYLLFANGSFVCLGATSRKMARSSIESMAKRLDVKITQCSVKNMVMSHNVNFNLNMRRLYDAIKSAGKVVIYEDELFNGMVWKEFGGTVRLFHNGKFFVTGLCDLKLIKNICLSVCKLCLQHKLIKGRESITV